MIGEGGETIVQGSLHLGPGECRAWLGRRGGNVRDQRRDETAGRTHSLLGGKAASRLIQPRPDRRSPGDHPRLLRQQQEGGLEDVLRRTAVNDRAERNAEDQPAMPVNQLRERRFVAGRGKRRQQLGVGSGLDAATRKGQGSIQDRW